MKEARPKNVIIYTLLEKRVFYTTEKEFSECPCIRTIFEH